MMMMMMMMHGEKCCFSHQDRHQGIKIKNKTKQNKTKNKLTLTLIITLTFIITTYLSSDECVYQMGIAVILVLNNVVEDFQQQRQMAMGVFATV